MVANFVFATMANCVASDKESASAAAVASATIIAPVQIAKTKDLNFGNITPSNAAGSVSLKTNGSRITKGGTSLPTNDPGKPTVAEFTITGEGNSAYSITIPKENITIINEDGSSMTINNIVCELKETGAMTNGRQTYRIGATLNVGPAQQKGHYINENDLCITVSYN